jgi:hypothetical protein
MIRESPAVDRVTERNTKVMALSSSAAARVLARPRNDWTLMSRGL